MTKVLVVGASGFVGSHLASELKRRKISFIASLRDVKSSNLNCVQYLITGSLKANFDWLPHFKSVEVIIFMAGRAHIQKELSKDPLKEYWAINVDAAINCAEQAAAAGVKRFIYLSTIKVNGENTSQGRLFSNKCLPCPQDAYAISKLEAEKQLQLIAKKSGIEVVIVRPPLIYGPGVGANFLMLMKIVHVGLPLPLKSVLSNKRSFISVYNLVDFIICCIEHPSAANEVFLVSDNSDISTVDLLSKLYELMGIRNRMFRFPIKVLVFIFKIFGKGPIIDRLTGSLQIDLSHASKKLNWLPPFSLEEGLHLTVCDYLGSKND